MSVLKISYLQSSLSTLQLILNSLQQLITKASFHIEFLHILNKAQQLLSNVNNYIRTNIATITRRMPSTLLLSIWYDWCVKSGITLKTFRLLYIFGSRPTSLIKIKTIALNCEWIISDKRELIVLGDMVYQLNEHLELVQANPQPFAKISCARMSDGILVVSDYENIFKYDIKMKKLSSMINLATPFFDCNENITVYIQNKKVYVMNSKSQSLEITCIKCPKAVSLYKKNVYILESCNRITIVTVDGSLVKRASFSFDTPFCIKVRHDLVGVVDLNGLWFLELNLDFLFKHDQEELDCFEISEEGQIYCSDLRKNLTLLKFGYC